MLVSVAADGTGVVGFSPILGALVPDTALEAKKVLLTETDLKVAGRLVEEVRECPWPSDFARSFRDASVSEPLLLTSVEFKTSSTRSSTSFSASEAALDSPLASGPAGACAEVVSETETSGLPSSVFVWPAQS